MKKLLLVLALCIGATNCFGGFQTVSAMENFEEPDEELIEQELAVAIVSGDGSAENPYIVDYSKAPEFKKHMDIINEQVMSSLQGPSSDMSTFGIFDGVLSGPSHSGQTLGGYWLYERNAPSAISNNMIWMKKVDYISVSDTARVYWLMYYDKLEDIGEELSDIITKPYEDAIEELIKKGIERVAGEALLNALGIAGTVFSVAEAMSAFIDCFTYAKYQTAYNNGYGMINAVYLTSYQGSWYQHVGEDTWTTAPTAYEPGSAYGVGTYYTNPHNFY